MFQRAVLASLLLTAAASSAAAQHLDESALAALEWRAIGPAVMGGRIDDVAVDEKQPSTIYVGSASGGVWKTVNAGTTWTPIFDHEGTASIGDIALSASNPDLVWVGTGEPNNRQSSTFGDGVYKSIDGGRSWTHMGLRDTQHVGRVIVDPVDSDTVYVAALGRLWGPSAERGVFKTTDGGRTWTNVKFIDQDTGFVDMAMDPGNHQVLYAAAYQRRRTPWGYNGGGAGSGLYKTIDGGRTWARLGGGLPQGIVGRIGLSVWRKDPRVVYATVEHRTEGGTYRSDDAGATWRKMSAVNPRPMYYSKIHVDPTDDRRLYVLGADFFVSDDGGRTFSDPATGRPGANTGMSPSYDVGVHGDHHALWIDPANPRHLVLGNDGGLYYSFDGSLTWDKVNNLPIGQFYGLSVDMAMPYNIYGGLQDTHSFGGPSATRHYLGILNGDWVQINTGDGMYAQVDPADPDTIYTESQDGTLSRFHRPTGDRKPIKPAAAAGEKPYRFNWTSPLVISPHDPKTLYFGGNRVFLSRDRGDTWTTVSADLTRAEDRDTLPIMGVLPGPEMLARNDGVGAWGAITTLAESTRQAGLLWAGTDDGLVHVTRDGGATWTNVTDRVPGPPRKARISRVEPGHADPAVIYVALDRHQDDDFAPYLFVSRDFGQTWKTLSAGLPRAGWINVVKEHPGNPNVLFVGTETGLFVSLDAGASWTRFTHGFPTVPVDDLVVHPRDNDLVVATHGRAIYVLDDITPLSAMTAAVAAADVHLFTPRPAAIVQRWKHESYSAQRVFAGPNPPDGAILTYHLKAAEDKAAITIRDASGAVVRALPGPAAAGFNRVAWDLRANAPAALAGARGPYVLPGTYAVQVQVGGHEARGELRVVPDAAFPVTDDDRRARLEFLTGVQALQAELAASATAIRGVRTQLTALQDQLKLLPDAPSSVRDGAAALDKTLADALGRIGAGGGGDGGDEGGGGGGLRGRVGGLYNELDGSGVHQGTLSGPTATQRQRLEAAQADARSALAAADTAMGASLAALNEEIARLKMPRLIRPR